MPVLAQIAVVAPDVAQARSQMGASLAFHIVLACMGVALPAVVMAAEYIGLRKNDQAALLLARRWSKVMGLLVAVGAVSGTVLSFEMGLLWPGLMGKFGSAIGIPFSIEGIFFLLEAVFVSIYLYGWSRLPKWVHFWSGAPVVISGVLGAWSVVAANSWINQPAGFTLSGGKVVRVDPLAVLFNNASWYEVPHMILAAYMVTAFLVASVYAVGLLRGRRDRYHRLGFLIPFTMGAIAAPIQIFVGDTAARAIAHQQPLKFAAMEYVVHTGRNVAEYLGGFFYSGHVHLGLAIPGLDSLLVGFSTNTKVTGWDSAPASLRPPFPTMLHLCFDLMVLIGTFLLALGVWLAWSWWRRRDLPKTKWFLRAAAVSGIAAVVAMESGWVDTEVGRQPWVVYKVLLTSQAATPAHGVTATMVGILVIYAVLVVATVMGLLVMAHRWRQQGEAGDFDTPYGPPTPPERSLDAPADEVMDRGGT
ncbi:MAG: cytochrome ubiquinol oxidase subunit I [Acidimicrobiales bacterium]